MEAKQLLLRGATLRRTRWVVGMVTYAGEQTKLQMNDDPGGEKTTHVMDLMQKALVVLLLTPPHYVPVPRAPSTRHPYAAYTPHTPWSSPRTAPCARAPPS